MERLLESRINAAADLRRILGLPCSNTNAYRLVNSEGDRLVNQTLEACLLTQMPVHFTVLKRVL